MKKKVFRLVFDFEKEENWLNSMAAKGWNLVSYTIGLYVFEKGVPGEYTYRIELLENLPSHPESQSYLEFMRESGVECVDTHLRWVYFRKKTSDGSFSIYTDSESKIKHYERIVWLLGAVAIMNLVIPISNLHAARLLPVFYLNFIIAFAAGKVAYGYWLKIRKIRKDKTVRE